MSGVVVRIEAAARAWRMADKFERAPMTEQRIADLNRLAAETMLNEMLKRSSISICKIDEIIQLVPGASKACPEYRILHALHCVELAGVPRELRESVPDLIRAVLTAGAVGVLS
jgi:hypothetical protein